MAIRKRHLELVPSPPEPDCTDRDTAIVAIRAALKERSGKAWSVTGGRGTSWGWIYVSAPPSRRNGGSQGYLTDEDRAELSQLLGVEVHHQGVSIPALADYRREYVARAQGKKPSIIAQPYWD
jgi:hypothetical protein